MGRRAYDEARRKKLPTPEVIGASHYLDVAANLGREENRVSLTPHVTYSGGQSGS
jgi:hypothetical protein